MTGWGMDGVFIPAFMRLILSKLFLTEKTRVAFRLTKIGIGRL